MTTESNIEELALSKIHEWTNDWCLFAKEVFNVTLDEEQQVILKSVQVNKRTSVASGTARGKDFIAAVAALCFLYLTPKWDDNGILIENTKIALTAPTDRQVKNIMMPEISRLYNQSKIELPGKLSTYDIRTENEEWFLTGFKADEHNHEAWSGFHAVNTMFVVTEASGISDNIFNAIEGNLQGNSRILIVFNPNTPIGYAARSQKGDTWNKFRLNSLSAPNVIEKKMTIPGQVDYNYVIERLNEWCVPILEGEVTTEEDDFEFENQWYRPNDLFRVKILGVFPKVSEDVLIPEQWIRLAQERWLSNDTDDYKLSEQNNNPEILGVDVAGMGRDSSVIVNKFGNYIKKFKKYNSAGKAEHMQLSGVIVNVLNNNKNSYASIDTIGEGAGVYSRLVELGYEKNAISCKYSEAAKDKRGNPLKDITEQYEFANMRAFLFWCVRDWLNPKNDFKPMLPPSENFIEEATEIKWKFRSDGKIIIEPKDDIKKRLGRSTDEFDALANTFYPIPNDKPQTNKYKYF